MNKTLHKTFPGGDLRGPGGGRGSRGLQGGGVWGGGGHLSAIRIGGTIR